MKKKTTNGGYSMVVVVPIVLYPHTDRYGSGNTTFCIHYTDYGNTSTNQVLGLQYQVLYSKLYAVL